MEEKNKLFLQKAIHTLPELEPDAALWKEIEQDLDFEDTIQKVVPALPLLEPRATSWVAIEQELIRQETTGKHSKMLPLLYYLVSAAACISLLIVVWFLVKSPSADKVILSYSQELVEPDPVGEYITQDTALAEAITFIKASCAQDMAVCYTPQFKELKSQLDELEVQMKKIQQERSLYGQDPELTKAQIKLENLQADITKELIQLLLT